MRIALLTDSDAFAGTERHMHDLDVALCTLGVDVDVCCPADTPLAERVTASGGNLHIVPRGKGPDVAAIRQLARRLKRGEIDLIHAHNGRTALIASAAKRLAGRGLAMMTQHFLAPAYTTRSGVKGVVSRTIHHWVDRGLDHVIAISDAVRDAALARHEKAPQDITTVHNGIQPPVARKSVAETRAALGIDAATPLVFAARLAAEKRIDVLIAAMAKLLHVFPNVRCAIAGTGEGKGMLQAQIDQLGIADRIQLLGFRDDVIDLMAASDVFVLPSDAEPFGLVVVEAMALGRCVIATDAGGPREIIEAGVSGLLAKPADADSLAARLAEVIDQPSRRAELGAAAARRFDDRFRAERMAREISAIYARVINVPPVQQGRAT